MISLFGPKNLQKQPIFPKWIQSMLDPVLHTFFNGEKIIQYFFSNWWNYFKTFWDINLYAKTLTIFNNDSFPNVNVFLSNLMLLKLLLQVQRGYSVEKKSIFETKRTSLGDANFEKLLLLGVNKDLWKLKFWCFDFF